MSTSEGIYSRDVDWRENKNEYFVPVFTMCNRESEFETNVTTCTHATEGSFISEPVAKKQ